MSKKVSQLDNLETVLDADILPVVNAGATKKVTKQNLLKEVVAAVATKASQEDLDTIQTDLQAVLDTKQSKIEYDIRDYGAIGSRQVLDGVLSGTTVTSATAGFTADDVGKLIFATSTNEIVRLYTTTITAYVSATSVTVGATGTNGSNYVITWGVDDTAAIQAAADACGPVGGSVKYPPGNYIVSDTIVWDKRTSTKAVLGPSMIGAEGRSGPSPDFDQLGTVHIICDPLNFPEGEYIFDYLGPTAQDKAICGVMVRGFVFTCTRRGAGVRFFNCFSTNMSDCILGFYPATPNPAIPGAFSSGTSCCFGKMA